jgi:uncharacterized membrane protein
VFPPREVIEMMWYYGAGASPWMWAAGVLMMLVVWGGLAALVVWAVRGLTRQPRAEDSADEILRRRVASGQISPDEYEKTRNVLRG